MCSLSAAAVCMCMHTQLCGCPSLCTVKVLLYMPYTVSYRIVHVCVYVCVCV